MQGLHSGRDVHRRALQGACSAACCRPVACSCATAGLQQVPVQRRGAQRRQRQVLLRVVLGRPREAAVANARRPLATVQSAHLRHAAQLLLRGRPGEQGGAHRRGHGSRRRVCRARAHGRAQRTHRPRLRHGDEAVLQKRRAQPDLSNPALDAQPRSALPSEAAGGAPCRKRGLCGRPRRLNRRTARGWPELGAAWGMLRR